MAPSSFSSRSAVRQDVLISTGAEPRHCMVLIDADCWTADKRPEAIAGLLAIPRGEWEALASSDRLILTLCENGEPYRMVLDGITGRFLARKL